MPVASLYHKVPTDQPIKLGGLKSASNAHTLIPTTIHAPDPPDMSILSPGLMNNVAIDTFNLGNATHNDHSLYPFLDGKQTAYDLSKSAQFTILHASLLVILPPITHYKNANFQGSHFSDTTLSSTPRPPTPPCSLEASALLEEQDVILESCNSLKGNYYSSPRIETIRKPSKDHDKLAITQSEAELPMDDDDETMSMDDTDMSYSVCKSTPSIVLSDYTNLMIDWVKTEASNDAEEASIENPLLQEALYTEFSVSKQQLNEDAWDLVSAQEL